MSALWLANFRRSVRLAAPDSLVVDRRPAYFAKVAALMPKDAEGYEGFMLERHARHIAGLLFQSKLWVERKPAIRVEDAAIIIPWPRRKS